MVTLTPGDDINAPRPDDDEVVGVAVVESVETDPSRLASPRATVYNFEVGGMHRYAVTDAGVVVHNVGCEPGMAGRFSTLASRSVVGDGLAVHHMPQTALGFTSRGEGGAIVIREAEHFLTRTFGSRGIATRAAEAGSSFRTVRARDVKDLRGIAGNKYDDGIRQLLRYYRENFPNLMRR